jgi:hypothetical protein
MKYCEVIGLQGTGLVCSDSGSVVLENNLFHKSTLHAVCLKNGARFVCSSESIAFFRFLLSLLPGFSLVSLSDSNDFLLLLFQHRLNERQCLPGADVGSSSVDGNDDTGNLTAC